ncbi:hypothetical protein V8C40DRAFT_235157 [Trichoderma camerunense]
MQEMNSPAHDIWLDTLKAAPTCGAHADLTGEAPPHVKHVRCRQSPRATSARGPQRNRDNLMADGRTPLHVLQLRRELMKRGSPRLLPS